MTSDLVERHPLKEKRRANKPLLERKRRARINDSLTDLKHLVLSSLNKDVSKYTKMEKVDILDMTVRFLKGHCLDQRQDDYSSVYRAGYRESTKETYQNIMTMDGLDHSLKCRILSNLANTQRDTEKLSSPPPSPTLSNEPRNPIPSTSLKQPCISSIFDPVTGQYVNTGRLFVPAASRATIPDTHHHQLKEVCRTNNMLSYPSKVPVTCIGVPTVRHTSSERNLEYEARKAPSSPVWRPW